MTDDTPGRESQTAAGQQLLRSDFDTTGWGPGMVREHVTKAVLAIEAELGEQAAAQVVASEHHYRRSLASLADGVDALLAAGTLDAPRRADLAGLVARARHTLG